MSRRRKHILIIALSIVAVGIFVTIGILHQGGKPPYHFIKESSVLRECVRDDVTHEECLYYFTFESDFNSVCADAVAELGSSGKRQRGWADGQSMNVMSFFTDESQRISSGQKYMIQIIDGFMPTDESLSSRDHKWVPSNGKVTVFLYWREKKWDIWQMIKDIF